MLHQVAARIARAPSLTDSLIKLVEPGLDAISGQGMSTAKGDSFSSLQEAMVHDRGAAADAAEMSEVCALLVEGLALTSQTVNPPPPNSLSLPLCVCVCVCVCVCLSLCTVSLSLSIYLSLSLSLSPCLSLSLSLSLLLPYPHPFLWQRLSMELRRHDVFHRRSSRG